MYLFCSFNPKWAASLSTLSVYGAGFPRNLDRVYAQHLKHFLSCSLHNGVYHSFSSCCGHLHHVLSLFTPGRLLDSIRVLDAQHWAKLGPALGQKAIKNGELIQCWSFLCVDSLAYPDPTCFGLFFSSFRWLFFVFCPECILVNTGELANKSSLSHYQKGNLQFRKCSCAKV